MERMDPRQSHRSAGRGRPARPVTRRGPAALVRSGLLAFLPPFAGFVLLFSAGLRLASDLWFDSYPDTVFDHPLESALVLVALLLITGGLLLGRSVVHIAPVERLRSLSTAPRGGVAIGGIAIALIAGILAFGFNAVCGFGCTPSEFWIGVAAFAASAAIGLLFAVVALSPRPAT